MEFNHASLEAPLVINGSKFIDDRGSLTFLNDFPLGSFKRFYIIQNHRAGFVRAWHGHMVEAKAFIPLQGTFLVGAVKLNNLTSPDVNAEPERRVIDSGNPEAFIIPPGYANGLMPLSEGAKLLVYSTSTLEESKLDDYRYPHDHWDIWKIENR
jgi:dTDP-4-dehydrorhamnose 3,5-epimerase